MVVFIRETISRWPAGRQTQNQSSVRYAMKTNRNSILIRLPSVLLSVSLPILFAGCAVGPDYKRPASTTPTQYKAEALGSWKEGQPLDHVPKGEWWEVF